MGSCNWAYSAGGAVPRITANLNRDYKNFFTYGNAVRINTASISVGDKIVTNARGMDGKTFKDKWTFYGDNGQNFGSDVIWGGDVTVTKVEKTNKLVKVTGRTESGRTVKRQFKRNDKTYIRRG